MFKRLFGGLLDSNEKEVGRLKSIIDKINTLEPDFQRLSDEELRSRTADFKSRIAQAVARFRDDIEKTRQELEDKRNCEADSLDPLEKEDLAHDCQNLESQLNKREADLQSAEKRALDEILPEAFAAVREAARRTLNQRHFDVQLMGGIVLHQGKIAEMKTGEGKTLVATAPLYLNSLTGRGVHLVTVNDYLARRDPYWMGPVFHALGVSVASIYPMQTQDEHQPSRLYDPEYDSGDKIWKHYRKITRKEAYQADIIYGTSSEFGFDYLRDNMVIDLKQCVQESLNYAIVDEVDNLLIDEARTPLIISGVAEESSDQYQRFARLVTRLTPDDYVVEEKERAVHLNDAGIVKMEGILGREGQLKSPNLYDPQNYSLTRYLDSALKANILFKKDKDYVVKDGEIIIVDEFTGRLMLGRRYSEGLHQAIEAKEGVKVQKESLTYATITIQNYFRMYSKLAGMTGTAVTEAEEFSKIYKLDVVVIPTNKEMERDDFPDRIYRDEDAKFNAVAREIEEVHETGQPILVGTVSIEKSERLEDLLKRRGVPVQILNAKNHEKEATVIAEAGKPGAVTVATNMAGRGVDIVLGGKEPEKPGSDADPAALKEWEKAHQEWQERHNRVLDIGGLHVIGTERHEARRIDNQLRGRSGRQGDPGSTRFYVALDDDIMRRFGGDRVKSIMSWAGLDDNTPIENSMVSKTLENSQVKVEGYHFDIRKHLVEYDDVVNKHRELIYRERKKILSGADLKANILNMIRKEIKSMVDERIVNHAGDEWDTAGLIADMNTIFPLPKDITADSLNRMDASAIEDKLIELAVNAYSEKEQAVESQDMRLLERLVMLRVIDSLWVEHLTAMENMRQQASWQTLRQVKAVDAYKTQGYQQFQLLLDTIQHDVARTIFRVNIHREEEKDISTPISKRAAADAGKASKVTARVAGKKVGRNDPCPCGSGKKFKHCCGK